MYKSYMYIRVLLEIIRILLVYNKFHGLWKGTRKTFLNKIIINGYKHNPEVIHHGNLPVSVTSLRRGNSLTYI